MLGERMSEAMRGGFGGRQEGAAVKRCWGPGLMESGQLGGRSRLGPKGEKSQGRRDSPGPCFLTGQLSPLSADIPDRHGRRAGGAAGTRE